MEVILAGFCENRDAQEARTEALWSGEDAGNAPFVDACLGFLLSGDEGGLSCLCGTWSVLGVWL